MNTGKIISSQVMEFLPLHEFQKCVNRYQSNYKPRNFSCLDQFLCMAFAQLTYRESLRDIQTCLRSMQSKLYHMGSRGKVSKSTLADANENRDWRIYADFAQVLIHSARELYSNDDFGLDLANTVYSLDSTTIDLCLSAFPWAKFRKTKAGIKLHTLLDLRGNIPTFIEITDALLHDVNILDVLVVEPGACYVMDRGYIDFFSTLPLETFRRILRCSIKKKARIQKSLLSRGRQIHRPAMRPNDCFNKFFQRLSGTTPACLFFRFRNRPTHNSFDRRLFSSGINDCPALQIQMAN